CTLGRYFDVW
nr:immunoglobulin heavy chain junction region [Mus musculus]MBK4184001.1 immunoglobulin heavy chain junction region [Mus musculus]MBK4184002.1 immunoglobulin heavy chain junction region [Mus musculus]MBK4184003.1 immunoglobulin heavy chain junction region [Mus musculus]MBK4184004.1 immunoglobulin heavy chain junction region [Mus musculus]